MSILKILTKVGLFLLIIISLTNFSFHSAYIEDLSTGFSLQDSIPKSITINKKKPSKSTEASLKSANQNNSSIYYAVSKTSSVSNVQGGGSENQFAQKSSSINKNLKVQESPLKSLNKEQKLEKNNLAKPVRVFKADASYNGSNGFAPSKSFSKSMQSNALGSQTAGKIFRGKASSESSNKASSKSGTSQTQKPISVKVSKKQKKK